MELIPVVENPRRRRRHKLSAKQIAAGFGGKRARLGRGRGRRRRNPALLASLGNPRRRRRASHRHSFRGLTSRSNPAFLGFDLEAAAWVGVGAIGSQTVPMLVKKFWDGVPTTGWGGYAVRAGATLATAYAAKMLTKNQRAFGLIMAGGLGLIFVDLFREYVAPNIGLSGYSDGSALVETNDLLDGMGGYVDDTSMSGFADTNFNPAIMTG
jgi:hypothetical protein